MRSSEDSMSMATDFIHEHEFVRVIMGRSKLKARPRKEPEKPPIELKKAARGQKAGRLNP